MTEDAFYDVVIPNSYAFSTVSKLDIEISDTFPSIKQEENNMAEVDTQMLSGQHADIRREAAEHASEIRYDVATRAGDIRRETADRFGEVRYDIGQGVNETVKETIKGDWNVERAVKDARHDNIVATDAVGDRLTSQLNSQMNRIESRDIDAIRDLSSLRSTIEVGQTMIMGGVAAAAQASAKEMEIAVLRNTIEAQKNTAYLGDKIGDEGEKTRALLNDLKFHDLNRSLIERNSELVEERNWGKHWYHGASQAQFGQQFAQLQSQMQNFNSQLTETRQGMVNFGTMAGNAGQQSSTSNNVR